MPKSPNTGNQWMEQNCIKPSIDLSSATTLVIQQFELWKLIHRAGHKVSKGKNLSAAKWGIFRHVAKQRAIRRSDFSTLNVKKRRECSFSTPPGAPSLPFCFCKHQAVRASYMYNQIKIRRWKVSQDRMPSGNIGLASWWNCAPYQAEKRSISSLIQAEVSGVSTLPSASLS